jgi:serine/threonine protein kinase/Flp pilus assembly protein TadD
MIGQTISHYRILGRLGQGGMGVVYKALDLDLGRHVALKFLPDMLKPGENQAKRMEREARAISALNHPNICTIHELAEYENRPYLVQELLEGATLEALIRQKKLPSETVLDIAIQLAEGLKAAHSKGLVHRDIKPSNLFLTNDGRAKILDFGLVRELDNSGPASADGPTMDHGPGELTEPGRIVGTLSYMSPEQLRGEPATPRSDIFSLGIVYFELLCGVHPFKKKSDFETASAILCEPSHSPLAETPMPRGLDALLTKMLAKKPDDRYADAGVLLDDLNRISQGLVHSRFAPFGEEGPDGANRSIAVLPFTNISPDKDNEYFGDGLAEELINALAKLEPLRVAARTSAFHFRGKDADVREVGQRLNVRSVLTGSVRASGKRLRVTTQLVNTADGFHLWAERYDRDMVDIFALQDEITEAIMGQLKVRLGLRNEPIAGRPPTHNMAAYNQYLKGRYFWNRRSAADVERAIECFSQAAESDPQFAAAFSGLADCYVILGVYGNHKPEDLFPLATEVARRALAINPGLAEAYTSLGSIRAIYDWDWTGAETDFEKAISLNPQYSTAYHWHASHCLIPLGRFSQARAQIAIAREKDPLSLPILSTAGLIAYFERNPDEAIAEYQRCVEMDPHFGLGFYFLGQAYEQKGAYADAIAALDRSLTLTRDRAEVIAALGHVHAMAGNQVEASRLLRQLQERTRTEYVSPVLLAQILLALGEREQAITHLQQAQQIRATDLVWLKVRPAFDSIQQDPRVVEVRNAIGLGDQAEVPA